MSKRSKKNPDTRHTNPDQHGADQYKRHVDGNIVIRGEIESRLPPDLQKKKDSSEGESNTRDKNRFTVEILTLFAVIIYAGLTFWQACLTRKIAKTAQDQLISSERAYVSFEGLGEGIKNTSAFTGEVFGELFPIEFENSGTTPVPTGRIQIGHAEKPFTEELPNGFDFPPDDSGGGLHSIVIGPKASTAVNFNIPTEALVKIQDRKVHWFIWGSLVYRDIFATTPVRVSEFCIEINGIKHRSNTIAPEFNNPTTQIVPNYGICKEHNCYDERCT